MALLLPDRKDHSVRPCFRADGEAHKQKFRKPPPVKCAIQTFQVVIFWVVTPCTDVVQYQCFRGPCCLHLQGEVNGAGKGTQK